MVMGATTTAIRTPSVIVVVYIVVSANVVVDTVGDTDVVANDNSGGGALFGLLRLSFL